MKLAIVNDQGELRHVVDAIETYDLDKSFARTHVIAQIKYAVNAELEAAGPQPNKAMVEGGRYEIRYRNPNHRRDRLDVLDYLGDDYTQSRAGHYIFSARPVAGTQSLPMDWVISMRQVPKSTPIAINRMAPGQ